VNEYEALVDEAVRTKRTVMLVGGLDTGKSTLSRRLLEAALGVLAVLDPEPAKAHEVGGFAAHPFVLTLHPDERKLYVSVIRRWMGGGADMLDEYDVETESFARRVYTFQPDDMSVRDMKIL
jgi:hypothetical protein